MTDQVLKGDASLADEIVQILRGRIINGEYAIGEKLVENKIAEELKVSRTPVREAFKQLTKENLIEYVPNKGCFAKGFDQQDLQDIYAVRNAVEQLAIEQVMKYKTEEDLVELKNCVEGMSLYSGSGEVEALLAATEDFNNVMFRMTKSRFIVQTLKSYHEYIQLARQGSMTKPENLKDILAEHRALYDALAEDDLEAAKAAIRDHLENSFRRAADRWL